MADFLLPNHFLSLPRPDSHEGAPEGAADISTLAAADFDVDNRTGFMPPQPPLARLPEEWEEWESVEDREMGERWREKVKKVSTRIQDLLLVVTC
ncbi:hypothetical protein OE88DRAFT_1662460 [Heliocybe sulcata]|uniref:Uncharacterized protein n=1 Tax=Heliocybe sulcata TaxID=5364 RepID=A0A5C3N7L4_9AGAM|nr:hypothetical protein OE88DRAFT_1662460 [Heliocybe sulcata]